VILYVDIVGVTGSIPVAPTNLFNSLATCSGEHFGADSVRKEQNRAGIVWEKSGKNDRIGVAKRHQSQAS
jgi:hypothetical protein